MGENFPVTDKFAARKVTELDFEIDPQDPRVYVNFDEVRPSDYLGDIKYLLDISDDRLSQPTDSFVKVLFSGHRGCGKTTELHRLQAYIYHPARYASIFIDMEKETDIPTFAPEDLFVTLILKLVERLQKKQIDLRSSQLDEILHDWLSDGEVIKELKDVYGLDISAGVEVGAGFFGFLKLKNAYKALFSSSSSTAKRIREKIKKNPYQLVERLNVAISEAREKLKEAGDGNDVLFIIDGFEKMPFEIFQQLFVRDSALIRNLECNVIFTIPINSTLDITNNPSAEFFQSYILPMMHVTAETSPLLAEIITRRIDRNTFFTEDALYQCVVKSGGCPRQLLRIVNKALVMVRGAAITPETVDKASHQLGQEMWDRLDSDHIKILNERTYNNADKKSLDLLFSLAVLKYNGQREINPLLLEFISTAEPVSQ
jgi:hypothetical protein